jgi:hypothetical protein
MIKHLKEWLRKKKIQSYLSKNCSDGYIAIGRMLLFTDITLKELNELFTSGGYKKI